MKKTIMTVLMTGAFAMPAQAQDAAALCKLLKVKTGVEAAYTPGVDAHGKPVAPADAGASMVIPTDIVQIPLTYDLAQKLNVAQGTKMEAGLGSLEIRDNNVRYNGQDLTPQAQAVCGLPVTASAAPVETAPAVAAPKAPSMQVPAAPAVPVVAMPVVPVPSSVRSENSLSQAARTPAGAVSREEGTSLSPEVAASIRDNGSKKGDIIWGQSN